MWVAARPRRPRLRCCTRGKVLKPVDYPHGLTTAVEIAASQKKIGVERKWEIETVKKVTLKREEMQSWR